ncbi:hypothetical protein CATMIT_01774, partial [Catenibacterium mitsuokai DSM 15897]
VAHIAKAQLRIGLQHQRGDAGDGRRGRRSSVHRADVVAGVVDGRSVGGQRVAHVAVGVAAAHATGQVGGDDGGLVRHRGVTRRISDLTPDSPPRPDTHSAAPGVE